VGIEFAALLPVRRDSIVDFGVTGYGLVSGRADGGPVNVLYDFALLLALRVRIPVGARHEHSEAVL